MGFLQHFFSSNSNKLLLTSQELEKQFIFVTKITNLTTGNPFRWNKNTKSLEITPSIYYCFARHFMAVMSVLGFIYQNYTLYEALKYKDQKYIETLLDWLYFSGGLVVIPLHIFFYVYESKIIEFSKDLYQLNSLFEREYNGTIAMFEKMNGKKPSKFTIGILNKFMQLLTYDHSTMAGLYCLRNPEHRRYVANLVLSPTIPKNVYHWAKYPLGFLSSWVRLLHRWNAITFVLFMQFTFTKVASYWIRIFKTNLNNNALMKTSYYDHIRALQILQRRYNNLFRQLNFLVVFTIWVNVELYAIFAVIERENIPYPEYPILPITSASFLVFMMILLKEMSNVRTYFVEFIQESKEKTCSIYRKKFIGSIKPMAIQLGSFFVVKNLAPFIFLGVSIDYFINGILTMKS